MKEYERASELRLTRRLPMIIRLDGKAFHSWTKKVGCVRPFDHRLMDMMAGVTQYLCESIAGTVLGYTQSDEGRFQIGVRLPIPCGANPYIETGLLDAGVGQLTTFRPPQPPCFLLYYVQVTRRMDSSIVSAGIFI